MRKETRKLLCLDLALYAALSNAVIPFVSAAEEKEVSAYMVRVGDDAFPSTIDGSGDGWRYRAVDHTLLLADYDGGGIYAFGELNVQTTGNVRVTSCDAGDGYPFVALGASDTLCVYNFGTLCVVGTDGADAVYAGKDAVVYGFDGSTLFSGANGIDAGEDVWLCGGTHTLRGENGSGIVCGGSVYFDCADASVSGDERAVDSPFPWCADEHTTVTGNRNDTVVTAARERYTLTLDGNGGTHDGQPSISFTLPYPDAVPLYENLFTRDGFTQTGWTTTPDGTDILPLYPSDGMYAPSADTVWYAYYEPNDGVTLFLHGCGENIGGKPYQKYTSSDVTLPKRDGGDKPFFWTDTASLVSDGACFAPGDTVTPDGSAPLSLYARELPDGQGALFHANGGTFSGGGTLYPQMNVSAASGDLVVYAPAEETLMPDADERVCGWSYDKDAYRAAVKFDEKLCVPEETCLRLYVVRRPASDRRIIRRAECVTDGDEWHMRYTVLDPYSGSVAYLPGTKTLADGFPAPLRVGTLADVTRDGRVIDESDEVYDDLTAATTYQLLSYDAATELALLRRTDDEKSEPFAADLSDAALSLLSEPSLDDMAALLSMGQYSPLTRETLAEMPDSLYSVYEPRLYPRRAPYIELLADLVPSGEDVPPRVRFAVVLSYRLPALPILCGDVNDDGFVDGADVDTLARYFAGYETPLLTEAADVTADGRIDGADLLRLAKYADGQAVTIGE